MPLMPQRRVMIGGGSGTPRDCDTVESICSHEFGHLLMYSYLFDVRTRDTILAWLEQLDTAEVAQTIDSAYSNSRNRDSSNRIESFAELFIALQHSGDHYAGTAVFDGFVRLIRELESLRLHELPKKSRSSDGWLWHYTSVDDYARIVEDGLLRPNRGRRASCSGTPGQLWFSSEPIWESSIVELSLEEALDTDGLYYRLGLPARSYGLVEWNKVKSYMARGEAMDSYAISWEASPADWFFTSQEVPVSDTTIQVLARGKWAPLSATTQGLDLGQTRATPSCSGGRR